MTTNRSYQPCFATVPDSWLGRWGLLREFTRRWHGLSLRPPGRYSSRVEREQSKLGIVLPPSFQEWLAFADELLAQDAFEILRDCYEITRIEEQGATSLLLQGEGDVYWAIRDENLTDSDPPVDTYCLDYESGDEDRFSLCGTEWPHITTFIFGHMAHFLDGKGGGCFVRVEATDDFLNEMHKAFPVNSCFDTIHIFEKQDLIVLILPTEYDPEKYHMLVEVFRPIPMSDIPNCVLVRTNNGGAFHGMFASE